MASAPPLAAAATVSAAGIDHAPLGGGVLPPGSGAKPWSSQLMQTFGEHSQWALDAGRKVLIIYTGGTIGMRNTPDGYVPAPNWLYQYLARSPTFSQDARDYLDGTKSEPPLVNQSVRRQPHVESDQNRDHSARYGDDGDGDDSDAGARDLDHLRQHKILAEQAKRRRAPILPIDEEDEEHEHLDDQVKTSAMRRDKSTTSVSTHRGSDSDDELDDESRAQRMRRAKRPQDEPKPGKQPHRPPRKRAHPVAASSDDDDSHHRRPERHGGTAALSALSSSSSSTSSSSSRSGSALDGTAKPRFIHEQFIHSNKFKAAAKQMVVDKRRQRGQMRTVIEDLPVLTLPPTRFSKVVRYSVLEYEQLLDSSDMAPTDWVRIAQTIYDYYGLYDAFVVLHGTDTMAYTASALSFMLENLSKTVILSGSQVPLSQPMSDAVDNLLGAISLAGQFEIPEVLVYFNYKLLRGNRTVKDHAEAFDAFHSPDFPILGRIGTSFRIEWTLLLRPTGKRLRVQTNVNRNVACVVMYPGITARVLKNFLAPPIQGVVLLTYGAGNCPERPEIFDLFKEATRRGVIILNISQCLRGGVVASYKSGVSLQRAGVISGVDMTLEAGLAKLSYVLGKTADRDKAIAMLNESIAGEMSVSTQQERTSLKSAGFIKTVTSVLFKQRATKVPGKVAMNPNDYGASLQQGIEDMDYEELDNMVTSSLGPVLLCSAAAVGDVRQMRELLEAGVSVNASDYDLRTPLHIAVCEGQIACARFLLAHGARVGSTDRYGHSPLDNAVLRDDQPMIDLLINEIKRHRRPSLHDPLSTLHVAVDEPVVPGSPQQHETVSSTELLGDGQVDDENLPSLSPTQSVAAEAAAGGGGVGGVGGVGGDASAASRTLPSNPRVVPVALSRAQPQHQTRREHTTPDLPPQLSPQQTLEQLRHIEQLQLKRQASEERKSGDAADGTSVRRRSISGRSFAMSTGSDAGVDLTDRRATLTSVNLEAVQYVKDALSSATVFSPRMGEAIATHKEVIPVRIPSAPPEPKSEVVSDVLTDSSAAMMTKEEAEDNCVVQ